MAFAHQMIRISSEVSSSDAVKPTTSDGEEELAQSRTLFNARRKKLLVLLHLQRSAPGC